MPVQCTCLTCGKSFPRPPSQPGWFCSRNCRSTGPRAHPLPPLRLSEDGLIAYVPLRGRDRQIKAHALIDADNVELVNQWRWCLDADGYAIRGDHRAVRPTTVKLHRALLGLTPADRLDVDHINRDRLDNRLANLRVVPKGANAQNMTSKPGSASRYRGVTWSKSTRRWQAQLFVDGKQTFLGCFDDEDEAGAAVREARLRLMPYAVD